MPAAGYLWPCVAAPLAAAHLLLETMVRQRQVAVAAACIRTAVHRAAGHLLPCAAAQQEAAQQEKRRRAAAAAAGGLNLRTQSRPMRAA